MHDRAHLFWLRQEMVQMSAPAGRIVAGSIAQRGCVVDHGFDALANPIGGFRLFCPDRGERGNHVRRLDLGDLNRTDLRKDVGLQGGCPLRRVLGVLPTGTLACDEFEGGFAECLGLCLLFLCDRVFAFGNEASRLHCTVAGHCEADIRIRAKPEITPPSLHLIAQHPGPCARGLYVEEKTASVAVTSWSCRFRLARAERHIVPTFIPTL